MLEPQLLENPIISIRKKFPSHGSKKHIDITTTIEIISMLLKSIKDHTHSHIQMKRKLPHNVEEYLKKLKPLNKDILQLEREFIEYKRMIKQNLP